MTMSLSESMPFEVRVLEPSVAIAQAYKAHGICLLETNIGTDEAPVNWKNC